MRASSNSSLKVDDSLDFFAPVFIGHANDSRIGDIRVADQHFIDLDRVDVHTARNDQLSRAPGEEQVAIGIETAHIAEREPVTAIARVRFGLLFVVLEPSGRRRLHVDQPFRPLRDRIAFDIQQLDLDTRHGFADGARLLQPLMRADEYTAAFR